jgi:hypothetical protein
MKLIELFLKNLKALFNNKTVSDVKKESNGSISFYLNNDSTIDIKVSLPNALDKNVEELTLLSEKYGVFINNVTDGSLSEIVLDVINNSKKDCKEPLQQLFIENIIFFWSVFFDEKKNQHRKKSKKNSPIIRPLAVFGRNQLN